MNNSTGNNPITEFLDRHPGITPYRLAKLLGVNHSVIAYWANGGTIAHKRILELALWAIEEKMKKD